MKPRPSPLTEEFQPVAHQGGDGKWVWINPFYATLIPAMRDSGEAITAQRREGGVMLLLAKLAKGRGKK